MNIKAIKSQAEAVTLKIEEVKSILNMMLRDKRMIYDTDSTDWFYENGAFHRFIQSYRYFTGKLPMIENQLISVTHGVTTLTYKYDWRENGCIIKLDVEDSQSEKEHSIEECKFLKTMRESLHSRRQIAKRKLVEAGLHVITREMDDYLKYGVSCRSVDGYIASRQVAIWCGYVNRCDEAFNEITSISTSESLSGEPVYNIPYIDNKTTKIAFNMSSDDLNHWGNCGYIEITPVYTEDRIYPIKIMATFYFEACSNDKLNAVCIGAKCKNESDILRRAAEIVDGLEKSEWVIDKENEVTNCIVHPVHNRESVMKALQAMLPNDLFSLETIDTYIPLSERVEEVIKISMKL